jgi:hypothetical protein
MKMEVSGSCRTLITQSEYKGFFFSVKELSVERVRGNVSTVKRIRCRK